MSENKQKTDFSNWLVATDIDGTLNNKLRHLPKKNLDAITEFVVEKKGNFTLASGRNPNSMRKTFESLPISKTPVVLFNGAGVYDYNTEKMLWFKEINEEGVLLTKSVIKKFPSVEVEIVTKDMMYCINAHLFVGAMLLVDKTPSKHCKIGEVPTNGWAKVIFMGMPNLISEVKKYLLSIEAPNVNFMSSSIASFEMLDGGVHKGVGVMKVAEILGVDYKHTAAIGDYFNDYEMLKSVYLPACCKQAPKGMHEIAKFEACHCNKGAVSDLLQYIMNVYKED
ncbi:MAG: HAD hydrolase family protein [Oscillospiraceae bacterium]